jgi:uncharacterized membrane protein YhhN
VTSVSTIVQIVLLAGSFAAALGYFALAEAPPSALRAAVKTAVFALFALFVATLVASGEYDPFALAVVAAALALSAVGDFLLALKDQQRYFVLGLASFLAAHLAYLVVFLPRASPPEAWPLVAAIAAVAAALTFVVRLTPRLGRMKAPVFAYFIVIMAMVVAALSIREAPWVVGLGAVLFALSDALIALRKFWRPFPGIGALIWATYCAAQYLIVFGLLSAPGLI